MSDRGTRIAGVTIALYALSLVAVSVRCYVRTCLIRSFGYDDWLIVVTLGFFTVYFILTLIGTHHGTGRKTSELTPHNFSVAMKVWFSCEIFYDLTSTFCKLAAGALLLRLTTQKIHVRIIWFVMILAGLFGIAFAGQVLAQCKPVSFYWSATRDPSQGHCVNPDIMAGFTYGHAVVSSIGDWTFGILPAFLVAGLNMNIRSKISVFLLLAFANIGSVATLIRIKAIHQIASSKDFLYETFDLAIWSTVEIGIAIMAASIATYKPLFRSFFSRGGSGARSFITAKGGHHLHNSSSFGHAPPLVMTLEEMKRQRKPALSEESTEEIFGLSKHTSGV